MRIAFFGLPLAALLLAGDGHDIRLAVLSPVPHVGRRRLERRISLQRVASPSDLDLNARVEATLHSEVDLIVSWFWTRKLPAAWLARPKLGAIGAHPSLLPRHRGPNPFYWAIDSGDSHTGVTIHRLTSEYDAGSILLQEPFAIDGRNAWQLARAADRVSLRLLRQAVRRLSVGRLAERDQDEKLVTMAPEPEGDALRVDWHWPTERVLRRLRALSPVPGLALEIRDLSFFVTRARGGVPGVGGLLPGEAAVCGSPPRQLCIATVDGAIFVEQAVLGNGTDFEPGMTLGPAELAELVAARQAPELSEGGSPKGSAS